MITGFEVFGAVTGALGVLSLGVTVIKSLSESISDYKGTGEHLLKIRIDLDSFQACILTWASLWEISNDTRQEVCELYWGVAGWQAIKTQLTVVDAITDEFTTLLCKWLPIYKTKQLEDATQIAIARKRRQGAGSSGFVQHERGTETFRFQRVGLFQGLADQIRDNDSNLVRIDYILRQQEKLEGYVTDFNDRFLRLQSQAELFFASTYPELDRGAPINERRRTVTSRSFLQQCLITRPASEALYRACKSADVEVPALDLHLPDDSTISGEKQGTSTFHAFYPPKYYLSVSNHTRQFDITTRKPGPEIASSFAQAAQRLEQQQSCTFEVDGSVFGMSRAVDPLKSDCSLPYRNLAGMLTHVSNLNPSRANKHLPRSAQMSLALDVVEFGLLTLGTSWTYRLDSRHLQPHVATERERRFLLNATGKHRSGLKSVEPHLFNIGVLLVEIILGRPILRIKKILVQEQLIELDLILASGDVSDDDEEYHDEYSNSDNEPEPKYLVAAEAILQVRRRTNWGFAGAVAFCLQQTPGTRKPRCVDTQRIPDWESRDRVYCEILDQYHREVYLPVKDLCSSYNPPGGRRRR